LKIKFYYFFSLLLFLTSAVIGQNSYDAQIKKGLNLSYNFQLDEAERVFSEAMQLSPGRPEAYHFTAQIHLWAFLGSKERSELKIFNLWSEMSITKAETLLRKNSGDYRLNYLLGNIYMLKAMAEGTDNSLLSAFSSSKASFSYFEKALKLNPGFYDAYKGMGLIHYALDFIPTVFKWAASVAGLKADRERGFYYLYTAYEKGSEDKIESAFHLSKMYTDYTGEYENAFNTLKPLLDKFPKNPMFNYQAAIIQFKEGNLNEAEKYLNKVILLNHKAVTQMNLLSVFLKGDVQFRKNDFAGSEKYYSDFVDKAKDADYTGIANLRLAVCRFINGRKSQYQKALLDAREGNADIFEDEYAKRVSMEINGRDLTQDEILFVKAKNDYYAHNYWNTIKNLSSAVHSFKDINLKAQGYVLLAECYISVQKPDDAEKNITYFNSCGTTNCKWTLPQSLYLRALIEYKKGNISKAQGFYEKALDENDYDFKDEISVRLNNLKRKIFKN
jgi:tetratricopeptide (TPR) repeat protein